MQVTLHGSRLRSRGEAIRENYDGLKPIYVCGEAIMPWILTDENTEVIDISGMNDAELEKAYDATRA